MKADYKGKIINKCFEVEIDGETISFDYLLRDGITHKMNAALLLKKLGKSPDPNAYICANFCKMSVGYSEEHIKTLEWREHIRLRPGMYIGKLGDGSSQDDGVYVLLKEVMDNAVDEYMMGNGKKIDVSITGREVRVRDFGRGIPLG